MKKQKNFPFKPLLQEIRLKNLSIRKIFLSSNILSFEIKKTHAVEVYRNVTKLNYIHPLSFDQKSLTDPPKG